MMNSRKLLVKLLAIADETEQQVNDNEGIAGENTPIQGDITKTLRSMGYEKLREQLDKYRSMISDAPEQ
jgi:hypothetical protein